MKTFRRKRKKKKKNWFLGKYFPPNVPLSSDFNKSGLWIWTGRVEEDRPVIVQIASKQSMLFRSHYIRASNPEEIARKYNREANPKDYHLKVASKDILLEYRYWLEGWHHEMFK